MGWSDEGEPPLSDWRVTKVVVWIGYTILVLCIIGDWIVQSVRKNIMGCGACRMECCGDESSHAGVVVNQEEVQPMSPNVNGMQQGGQMDGQMMMMDGTQMAHMQQPQYGHVIHNQQY